MLTQRQEHPVDGNNSVGGRNWTVAISQAAGKPTLPGRLMVPV